MTLRCAEVRELMAAPLPLSEEWAEAVAEHVDHCDLCDRELSRQIAEVVNAVPAIGNPSLSEVRRRARDERRATRFFRSAAAAAALFALLATGWALFKQRPVPAAPAAASRPIEEAIPNPPPLAELRTVDRQLVQSEGVLALYLQFCLSCLNQPTEEDKREFLIRTLLIFREARGSMRSRYERGGEPAPDVDTVTREGLSEALQTLRASPLSSVKLLPAKITGFKLETPERWRVDHLLGSTPYRLTLETAPLYLNFSYLKKALGADDALMGRIEEALWFDAYVNLSKRLVDKDPTLAPKVLEALLPLLSPRQQEIYRKIVGPT